MKQRPVERLEKTLARVAKEQGLAQERLRRWVSFLALCGVLERAVNEGILDRYDLKGGVALELRFAESARATKDIDIGVSAQREKRLRVFQDAVALGFDEFTFQLKGKPLSMDKVDAVRLDSLSGIEPERGRRSRLTWVRRGQAQSISSCLRFGGLRQWDCGCRHPFDA